MADLTSSVRPGSALGMRLLCCRFNVSRGLGVAPAPPASPGIYAPALLLESLRNPCRRAARRPGTSAVRSLDRAARDRPERGGAAPARARYRRAPGHLRECRLWLSRAMAVGADRRRDHGAEAFAVRAGPARVALLPAAGPSGQCGRSAALECVAAFAHVSRCGGRFDALRTRAAR